MPSAPLDAALGATSKQGRAHRRATQAQLGHGQLAGRRGARRRARGSGAAASSGCCGLPEARGGRGNGALGWSTCRGFPHHCRPLRGARRRRAAARQRQPGASGHCAERHLGPGGRRHCSRCAGPAHGPGWGGDACPCRPRPAARCRRPGRLQPAGRPGWWCRLGARCGRWRCSHTAPRRHRAGPWLRRRCCCCCCAGPATQRGL